MRDADKTKDQLLKELSDMRQRIAELEKAICFTNATQHKPIEEVATLSAGTLERLRAEVDERKRAEEALQTSQDRLASMLRAAPTGIGVVVDRIITEVSETLCNTIGYTKEELIGKSARMLYPTDEDFNFVGSEKYRQIAERGVGSVETRWQRKDGRILHIILSSAPIAPTDLSLGVTFTAVDITERKKAEEALRTSEAKFRSYIEQSPVAIFVAHKDGQLIQVNRSAAQLLGYDAPTLLSMVIWELHPVEDRDEALRDFAALSRDGRLDAEHRFQRQDGSIIWVSLHVTTIEGGLSLAYCLDITNRRQTEEILRRYEMLSGNIRDIILFMERESGKILEANAAAERAYGYSREELLNLTIRDLRAPEAVAPMAVQMADADARGILFETTHRRKDGSTFLAEVSSRGATINGIRTLISIIRDITDRKQDEEALRWKTALLEAQVNTSIDGILVVDENNRRIITNRRLIDLWDVPQHILDDGDDTALLQHVVSLAKYPEEFLERVMYLYDHPYEISRDEVEFKSGMVLDRYSAPVLDDSGHHYGRIWTFRDMTERKRAEEELRESEERFRTLIEGAPEAIFVQAGGLLLYLNPAMLRLLGASTPEELLEKGFLAWAAPEYHESIRARMKVQLETGKAVPPVEREYLRFDGSRVPVESAGVPVKFEGTVAHLVFVRDITERKRAEEELRQSEEMYRTLIAASPDAITVTDLSGRVTLASRKALELWGIPSEHHVIGRSILEWNRPEDRIEANAAMQQLLKTGITRPRELVVRRDDGTLFDAEVHAAPIQSSDGRIRGAILITRDVTERNNLQAQLLQSQKMEAIGTLAGGVAHDFNNILMALMGYTNLVGMGIPHDHPVRTYVEQILSCTSKAANLTRSLLAFSRKQSIELKPLTANIILSDLEKLLRRIVPEDVKFTLSLNEDVTIMADMTQIDQVLINLVSNARDAMPKGGALHIETNTVELGKEFKQTNGFGKPGMYGMISVTDTGNGMDEATQKKIFEPFFTTKEVGKGTGLGLSIVYGIIKQHGGYITVSSEPGKGSVFSLYLPAVKAEVSEARQAPEEVPGGTETLLLAEDNPDVRKIAKEMLCMSGYTVVEAKDGEDAVTQYMEHRDRIDLLMLDVVMPGKNGKEAYDEIRKVNPSIRALFMSGYTGDVVLEKGIQDTAVDYISKPLSVAELLKKIREVLGR